MESVPKQTPEAHHNIFETDVTAIHYSDNTANGYSGMSKTNLGNYHTTQMILRVDLSRCRRRLSKAAEISSAAIKFNSTVSIDDKRSFSTWITAVSVERCLR